MSYIYQAQTPLTEDKLKQLKEKLRCEIKYDAKEAHDVAHYYVVDKNLSLQEMRLIEDYGLELLIGMAQTSKSPDKPT